MENRLHSTALLGALLIALSPGGRLQAQDNDCGFTYTLETGCNPDGTGWATVSDVQGTDWPVSVHWNYSETAGDPTTSPLTNGTHTVSVFDITGCDVTLTFTIDCAPQEDEEDDNCQFRTQTQGGWGSNPSGNNPGAYLAANFAAAFPGGLEIGCDNTLRLTSAAAVRAFLPSGTSARQLPAGTLTDPGNSYRNVLAGQLVALTLSLGFDAYDPDFGTSNNSLANAVFQSGTFQGWRVFEVVDEANRFIGGCGSAYTASQLNGALTMVNENYVDGTTDNGNLGCGLEERPRSSRSGGLDVKLLGTPATGTLDLTIVSTENGPVTIELRDPTGRLTGKPRILPATANSPLRTAIGLEGLTPGNYFISVTQGDQRVAQRFPLVQ